MKLRVGKWKKDTRNTFRKHRRKDYATDIFMRTSYSFKDTGEPIALPNKIGHFWKVSTSFSTFISVCHSVLCALCYWKVL